MGQKVNPISFRLICRRKWRSAWFANNKEFAKFIKEDADIRKFLSKKPSCVGATDYIIRRMSDKIEITIRTARPGLVIGKKGAEINKLKEDLCRLTGKNIWLEVEEIKRPDLAAQLVGDNVARQLERRIPFRRAVKKAIQATMDAGAQGVKIQVSGRLGGAEIARTERYHKGSVPLHTLRAEIDYATSRSATTYGIIGVKVWIHTGDEVVPATGSR